MVGGVRAEPHHARRDRIAAIAAVLFTLIALAGLVVLGLRHSPSESRSSLLAQGQVMTPAPKAEPSPTGPPVRAAGMPTASHGQATSGPSASSGPTGPAARTPSPGPTSPPPARATPTPSLPTASPPISTAPPTAPPGSGSSASRPLVFTYFYYWYDSVSGSHLQPDVLHNHFPPSPSPTWRTPDWDRQQLADMSAAGIDVALPVFWGYADGPPDPWSMGGLPALATAWHQAQQQGEQPPKLGMFLDTTIVNGRDLTTPDGMAWFYGNFHNYFSLIPRDEWALVDGRPVIFLFSSDYTGAFNQTTFDYAYSHFQADFGVRPYIVREISWDY